MLLEAWLFVGLLGVLATTVTLYTTDDALAIVSGTAGFVVWGVWTYGAFQLEVPIQNNSELTFTEPTIAIVGVIMALIPGFIALTGPVELVQRYRRADTDDL